MTIQKLADKLADQVRLGVENRFDAAILTILDTFADLEDEDNICVGYTENLGVIINKDEIEFHDIENSKTYFSLKVVFD